MCSLTTISTSVVLLVFIVVATTESKPAKDSQHILNIQACGKELADLLASTCHLGYNIQTKTFVPSASVDENATDNNLVDNESNNASQEKRNIHKRSIIQECCMQPCKWHDLLTYCHNGSSVTIEPPIDKLKALGVRVITESPFTFVFHPLDNNVNPSQNRERYSTITEKKVNELQSNSEDVQEIGTKRTTLNTHEKSENIAGISNNERGINSHIKVITPYHCGKTPIIIDNRPLNMQSPQPEV